MRLPVGTRLGPYLVRSLLAGGGMGEVYRARDTRLGRDVAVKVLADRLAGSRQIRARFEREARVASRLNHPHICVIHDVGREGETDFLVMELVEGESLARRIARGALPASMVASLGAQIADALAAAHRAGVVHRDLKPDNIMLTRSGVKLMDFGLAGLVSPAPQQGGADGARLRGYPSSAKPSTGYGAMAGTIPYMAPELIAGAPCDARSDIWALGCVLYEMATGRRPYEGDSAASVVDAILNDQPRPMSELAPSASAALERLVNQCLAKDPEERWQSARDLGRELLWIAEGAPEGRAPGIAARNGRAAPTRVAGALVGLAAVAVLASYGIIRSIEASERRFTFIPLTWRPMTIFTAAFAPDGKSVFFTAAINGERRRIFVTRPESFEHRPITEPGTQLVSVSSKGDLAVLTGVDHAKPIVEGTLARMPLEGGAPRKLVERVRWADWTPDARDLAIVRVTEVKDQLEYPIGNVLWESTGWMSRLCFSPRGDRIAFFDHPGPGDNRGWVCVVDLAGVGKRLTDQYYSLEGLAWSDDGREILFSASDGDSPSKIHATTPAGRHRIVLEPPGGQTIHDVSREGRWLTSHDEVRSAVMVGKPGWTHDRDFSWLAASGGGSLSSDGGALAFTEHGATAGSHYAVCLRPVDGSPGTRLGEGVAWGFSPDGEWVLAAVPSTPPQIVAYPTGPGETRRLSQGTMSSIFRAWWSPTGDHVVFVGNESGRPWRFYVQSLDGRPARAVTPEGVASGAPASDSPGILALAPDGTYSVYSLAPDEPDPVRGLSGADVVLSWQSRTRSALVVRPAGIPVRVERVDIDTGLRTRVLEIHPPNREGLTACSFIWVSEDHRSYSYSVERMLSTLFLGEPSD